MIKTILTVSYCECKRCGWGWLPRQLNVNICPRCKSPNWNKERENRKGLKDGNETSIHELRDKQKKE